MALPWGSDFSRLVSDNNTTKVAPPNGRSAKVILKRTTIRAFSIISFYKWYNLEDLTDSAIVHSDNQRAQDSENRIKELKNDFGARQTPCGDFDANALYFDICALSYNLFVLMRQLLPVEFVNKRAKYVRHRLYAVAKVVLHGRQVIVKCQGRCYDFLKQVLSDFRMFKPLLI